MQLKPEQISRIIRSQIKYYENAIEQTETGTVTMVGDGIARAAGLDNCMAGELVQFESGTYGMAQNLEENSVSIVLLGDDEGIKEGSTIKRTGKVVSVPVGEGMIGRVVNALGQPIDGKGPIEAADYRAIESPAPGILDRQPVKQPLPDRQDRHCHRYHHQPEGQGRSVHLCCHRSEALYRGNAGRESRKKRRYGVHNRCLRHRVRAVAFAVYRPLRRLRHG